MSSDSEYIEAFLSFVAVRGINPETVESYRRDLERFARYPEVSRTGSLLCVTPEIVHRYCRDLHESSGFVLQTIYQKKRAVYEFYQWLKDEGVILHNPVRRPTLRRAEYIGRRSVSVNAVRQLLSTLSDSHYKHDRRNSVIVDLAYCCGLRRCELLRLNVHDVNATDHTIRVRGKFGKERIVPVGKMTMAALLHYLYHDRPTFLHGNTTSALFVSWMHGGRRISRATVTRIFLRLRRKGKLAEPMTSHSLRHAFATHLLRNGAPVQDVSKMLGHESIETTQHYTHLVPMDLKEHHRRYHPRG